MLEASYSSSTSCRWMVVFSRSNFTDKEVQDSPSSSCTSNRDDEPFDDNGSGDSLERAPDSTMMSNIGMLSIVGEDVKFFSLEPDAPSDQTSPNVLCLRGAGEQMV